MKPDDRTQGSEVNRVPFGMAFRRLHATAATPRASFYVELLDQVLLPGEPNFRLASLATIQPRPGLVSQNPTLWDFVQTIATGAERIEHEMRALAKSRRPRS